MKIRYLFSGLALFATSLLLQAQNPVTMESLLREMVNRKKLTEWPETSYRTLQASSYNRESVSPDLPGWFADSDGVYCIRTEEKNGETEWVLMEDDGPGAITKIWAVCFYYGLDNTTGANIKIYLDGAEEPVINTNFFNLVKGLDFVQPPLAAETRRAGNIYFPIPYARSCKITMDKKVFYNIVNYRSYPANTNVVSFTHEQVEKCRPLVDSVNTVLAQGAYSIRRGKSNKTRVLSHTIAPGKTLKMELPKGNRAVERLQIHMDAANLPQALRSTVMKAAFDGEQTIWTPVGDFFCNGVGMKSYKTWERAVDDKGMMTCRWVMPYRNNGAFEFENLGDQPVKLSVNIDTDINPWTDRTMHFHASWRMDNPTPGFPLFDYNLLEAEGKGVYVGDQFTVLNPAEGWWGEGDEKVYVDDDFDRNFPSHFGTGTEDYYGWAGGVVPNPIDEFAVPFLANVRVAAPNSKGYNTCTRTRALDAIPFERRLRFDIESSGSVRNSWFHLQYAVNTYWYALPGSSNNRKPLPEMAAAPIPTLEGLMAYNENCKKNNYTVSGAIEAENLDTYQFPDAVREQSEISIWGEKSNGAIRGYRLPGGDSYVRVRLTELFSEVPLKICLVTHNQGGVFDVLVNGTFVKEVNLYSEHAAMPVIDFGRFTPVDNALEITFRHKGDKEVNLGIDYFLLQ